MSVSNFFNLLLSVGTIVPDSHPYIAMVQTIVCISLLFCCKFSERSFHRLVCDLAADLAMPSLAALQSHVSGWAQPTLLYFIL